MQIKTLTKYRNCWLGMAMMWIVLYHTNLSLPTAPLRFLKYMGYGGVDICLFASGLGCYLSLSRDSDILGFMKRRFSRLAPTYLPFIILWLVGKSLSSGFSFQMALGNILGIQNFTGRGTDFNWYISALILLYILAPYFKAIIDQTGLKGSMRTLAILLLCSVPFWQAHTYIITMSRLPIFFIGMCVGKLCTEENRTLTHAQIAVTLLAMLLGLIALAFFLKLLDPYLWSYALYWYPFILITPGLCLCISALMHWMENHRIFPQAKAALEIVGKNSFEIFLVHIPMTDAVYACLRTWELDAYSDLLWMLYILLLPAVCICFKKYVSFVRRFANRWFR